MANAQTQFGGFLTNVGVVKQTNANALQIPWKITRMELGDAGGEPALFPDPTPSPTQTALINVVYDAPLNSLYPSPDDPGVLIAELVLPPNVGGWWIRETALRDEDGDLIAVAAPAPSYKPLLVQNTGRTQTIRMHVVVGNTANIQLKIDPSVVLATRAQVEAGDAEARAYAAGLMTAHQEAANPHPQYSLRGAVTALSVSATLTPAQLGLVLIDGSGGDVVVELPESNSALGIRDVILRRTDSTGNRLVIQTTGNDRIKFHTHLRTEGYPFLVLMGAGDYWHLRSDGEGNWWPVARRDEFPVGNYADGSAAIIPPGGYGLATGTVQAADYPWLLDLAQQSDALVAVGAREAKDGRWSISTDGQTIYLPSPGSTFRRLHDLSGSRDLGTRQSQGVQELSLRAVPGSGSSTIVTGGTGGTTSPANLTVGGGTFRTSPHSNFYVGDGDETRPENITAYPLFKLI